MRHRKRGRKFGRVRKVRRALFRSLLGALVLKGKIKTTEAKAKELRPKIEKIITKAKIGALAQRRLVTKELGPREVRKLFDEIAPKMKGRAGGYTRITKLPPRPSDRAKMAIIEFVE